MDSDNLMLVLTLVAQGLANDSFPNQTIEEYVVACLGRPRANQLVNEISKLNHYSLSELLKEVKRGKEDSGT